MKKLFKKLLSLALVCVMLIPMISATGLTLSARTYSGECGYDGVEWYLDIETGVLTVDGWCDMYNYDFPRGDSKNIAPWSDLYYYIKSVVIAPGVTGIGSYAFCGGVNITSVTIGDTVTTIGKDAFSGCSSLESVIIPDSVTAIGASAFRDCDLLYDITVPDSVKSIGEYAFYSTAYYEDKSNWTDDSLYAGNHIVDVKTSISGLYEIREGTKCIADQAFYECSSLTGVTIPDSVVNIGNWAFRDCTALTDLVIGNSVRYIGDYAFCRCKPLTSVIIPDSVIRIGEGAFDTCTSLESIVIPATVEYIGGYAFSDCGKLTIKCYRNSCAYKYAKEYGIEYLLIETHTGNCGKDLTWSLNPAEGVLYINGKGDMDNFYYTSSPWYDDRKYVRSVVIGDSVTSIGRCAFYEYSNLTSVIIGDSVESIGESAFECCTALTSIIIPDSVNEIHRYAFFGCSLLIKCFKGSNAHAYAVENGFEYELICIDPEVSSYGVRITIEKLKDVRDIFIAKGEFNSYKEIKGNGYIVRITENKLADKDSYTYSVSDYGLHTVLVRYNDGEELIFHEEIKVDEPVFTTNGLQITVSNIPDVKVIRTAYGEYNTPGEVKRAEGARNYSAKAINGAAEYTVQYRKEGRVTVAVEYNNGYIKIFHYDVAKKTPVLEQNGNTVEFTGLDGLKVIRYAPGEYTASGEIKRAEGSKYLRGSDITEDTALITGLEKGIYTFCVQFDDESYNYYTVIVE